MKVEYSDDATRVYRLTSGRRIVAAKGIGDVWRAALCGGDGDGRVVELGVHAGPTLDDVIERCLADDWSVV